MPSNPRLSWLAVPLLALIWGLNWPAVRAVLSWWSPWMLRLLGMGIGAVLLFALARQRGVSLRINRDQWSRLTVSALLTIAGFNLCTAFAQLSGSTSRAAIVTFTMPVWAILFARFALGEPLDRRRITALLSGISGLALLSAPLWAKGSETSSNTLAGVLFALGAGVSWAAGTVFVKRFPIAAPPLASTAWQLAIGAAVSTLGGVTAAAIEGRSIVDTFLTGLDPPFTTGMFTLALAFHIVLACALAYLIWFDIVSRLPAGIAALATLLIPVVGTIGAMLLLGERPSALDLVGFVLIIAAAATALLPSGRPGSA